MVDSTVQETIQTSPGATIIAVQVCGYINVKLAIVLNYFTWALTYS